MASNISDTRPLSSSNLKGSLPTASSSLGIPSSTTSSTTATTATSMVPPLSTTSISSTGMPQTSSALPADIIWRWVDHVMRRERGQSAVSWTSLKGIEDPSTDFADGIRLIRLIETLSGHRATGPFHLSTTSGGLDEFDSVDNIRMAFRMLRSEGLEPGFKPAYLYRPGPQRQHLLTDLLWRIMLHFRFYQHAIGTRGAASYSPEERMDIIRQHLLDWVRDKTSRHVDNLRMKRIENLSSGWDDGLIYLMLLHEYDPSIVTHDDLRNYSLPGQRARSFATALSLAKRHLGIPKLVSSPEGILDENSNIAFLCEFWYKFYQHEGYGEEHPGIRGVEQRELPRQEPRLYREGGLASSTGGIQREIPRHERLYREGGLASSTGGIERGLPYHEEERLRADQMRLEAENERKRAEEERYKAMEAKRKAEADRLAAEQEAKRALDRREMALREKERLEAERRIADDERRQAMEAVRRAEVERLRVEQERKRLEDEVRRAEERARAEELRRYAQVKMEEAERERFRAQEERRLAREEMILADHELKLAEEERRRADMEMRLAESERLRASREGLYTPEARALPTTPAVVPTQTTVRVVPTHPVAPTTIATQTLPVTQGPISSVTTHPISIEEKKRRKAEKKARRAQEELSQAEKLRRKEEKRRLRAEADRKRLEDYVVMTQNVLIGVLQLSVVEARGMGRGVHKPYAKVKLEKQKMKTKTIKKTLIPQWRSDFKLYHSDPDAILKVRVYDKGGRFGGKRFIGRVDIPARDLEDGVEQDLWYPLHYKTAYEKKLRAKEKRKREKERYKGWVPEEVRAWRGDEPLGEIHLRLLYRKDPLYTKPGIYDK